MNEEPDPEDKKRPVLILPHTGTGAILANLFASHFSAEAQEVDLMRAMPEVDTRKGPEQLTYHDRLRMQADIEQKRVDRAEEKRRRRAAKLMGKN